MIDLFIFSISFWFSLGRLYFSKNFPLLHVVHFFWHIVAHCSLFWSFVLHFSIVCCNSPSPFSFPFYWFESSLFFSWWVWLIVNIVYLLKEPTFSFIDFCYCLLHLFFIYFCSDLCKSKNQLHAIYREPILNAKMKTG